MKLHLFCAALLAVDTCMHAAEWDICVDLQMVAVPMAQALPLVPQLTRAETFPAAAAQLQRLLETGEAELIGWPLVQSKNDDTARTAAIDEVRYPTDYLPPMLPSGIGNGLVRPTFYYAINPPQRYITPTAFETRNTGPTLEARAAASTDGKSLDLEITPQLVLLEVATHTIGTRDEYPGDAYQQQPQFTCLRTMARFTLPNGGRCLIGTFVLPEPQPRVLLFLVHAIATPAPSAAP